MRRLPSAGIAVMLIGTVPALLALAGCGSNGGSPSAETATGSGAAPSSGAKTSSSGGAKTSSAGESKTSTSGERQASSGGAETSSSGAEPKASSAEAAGGREEVTLTVPASLAGGLLSSPHQLEVPKGWTAGVWARPEGARMMAVTPEGNLLVSQPDDGVVLELAGGQVAERESAILSGLESPQGLAFARRDGKWVLYVGESDQIDAYPWSDGKAGGQRVIAPDLPDEEPSGDDIHRQKDVAVAPDGTIYFDVGSSSNASPADRGYDPPRGVIDSVGPSGGPVKVVMRGVRNGEGLAVAPDGSIWTAVNNRDEIEYPFHKEAEGHADAFGQVVRSYVDDHPPDEVAQVRQGRDLGWPLCNPEQADSTPPGSFADVPLIADAENNADGTALDCAALPPIEVGLPAHSAPLGMSFLAGSKVPAPWSGGAVIAAHGSWDRQEPRPPAVLWLPWDEKHHTLLPARTLVGGFQEANGERWGRPVDVVPGPAGELFVSDDTAGAIYKLTPP